jgi:uncharacterized SAM-binding protein YcdF (DUF218 family)
MNKVKKAIIVMGGGLVEKKNHWKTIDLGEGGDKFAISNDRWRVDAAFELWKTRPDYFIIASGGKGQLKKISGAPNISSVVKRELIELGVSETSIIEESISGSTFSQLKEIAILAFKKKFTDLIIISNEWHVPRIEAMLEHAPGLSSAFSSLKVTLVSAESVLLKVDSDKWQTRILKARNGPEMKKRFALEEKGVQEIKAGTYKYSS